MTRRFALLLFAVYASSCVARSRINATCQWTNDASFRLDVQHSAEVRHLVNDAALAEDLAIRYADATRGHRSGHYAGSDQYTAAREQCVATLFAAIASTHGVNAQQVRDVRGRRPVGVDVSVGLSFAALYFLISIAVAGTIVRRFPIDEPTPAVVASAIAAAVLSAFGTIALGLWATVIEMTRIGATHLSYRADRLPWTHHTIMFFATGVVMLLSTAAFRYYRDHHHAEFTK